VHEVALPVAELAAKMGFGRALMDRRPVGDGGLAPAIAPSPAALRLSLRKLARQSRLPAGRAVGVAVDRLRADPVLRSVELHPPRDLLGGPTHGKAVSKWSRRGVERAILDPRSLRAQARRPALSGR